MLVLTRKRNQAVRIGQHVVVHVLDVRGHDVRLGIEAPRVVPVHRAEVQTPTTPDVVANGGDGLLAARILVERVGLDDAIVLLHQAAEL